MFRILVAACWCSPRKIKFASKHPMVAKGIPLMKKTTATAKLQSMTRIQKTFDLKDLRSSVLIFLCMWFDMSLCITSSSCYADAYYFAPTLERHRSEIINLLIRTPKACENLLFPEPIKPRAWKVFISVSVKPFDRVVNWKLYSFHNKLKTNSS